MRYLTIPEPIEVPDVFVTSPTGAQLPFKLELHSLVEFTIALESCWKQDEAWLTAILETLDAMRGKKPGEVVALEDKHVEKLQLAYKECKIRPEMSASAMRLMRAVFLAPKEDPRAKAEPASDPKTKPAKKAS